MSFFDKYFVWALYGKKTSHSLLPFSFSHHAEPVELAGTRKHDLGNEGRATTLIEDSAQ